MRKKKKDEPELITVGDMVTYGGKTYKIVQLFGAGKCAVIEDKDNRFSVEVSRLKKAEV